MINNFDSSTLDGIANVPQDFGAVAPVAPAGVARIRPLAHIPIQGSRTGTFGRGPTTIVIESGSTRTADRLDSELRVAARLQLPVSTEQLARSLSHHRPKLLLCKHPLDSIDETFLDACRCHDVEIYVLANSVYGVFKNARLRRYGGLPWIQLRRRSGWSVDLRAKRWMDLLIVLLTSLLTLPLMLMILLAVCCSGPPLYFQERVGTGGRPFRMIKFRTMQVDAECGTGPVLSAGGDVRVTRVGRYLRRYRLDELPQLINVLTGKMSLVGPRPERPEFVRELLQLPNYQLRHLVRPGMTGIAQLTGGYAATPEEKLRCDLLYLHSRSVRSDTRLLILTCVELFSGFPRG